MRKRKKKRNCVMRSYQLAERQLETSLAQGWRAPASVAVTVMHARGIRAADVMGASDPYVTVHPHPYPIA
jgi:hypothetical protein